MKTIQESVLNERPQYLMAEGVTYMSESAHQDRAHPAFNPLR